MSRTPRPTKLRMEPLETRTLLAIDVVASVPAAMPLPGDTNGDDVVDLRDFQSVKDHFGEAGGRSEGDFNGDGKVDLEDFEILKSYFGTERVVGDVDLDGVLDEDDLIEFADTFGSTSADINTDLDGDRDVDLNDLAVLKQSMQQNFDFDGARQRAFEHAIFSAGQPFTPPPDGPDVPTQKLDQAIRALVKTNQTTEFYDAAIDEVFEALFTSNLVPLPTQDVPETQDFFEDHLPKIEEAIEALGLHVDRSARGTPESKELALEARNMLQLYSEAVQVIADQTGGCNAENLQGNGCGLLLELDEAGDVVDPVSDHLAQDDTPAGANIHLTGLGARFVRGPFPFFRRAAFDGGTEVTVVTDALADGEAAVVLKEIRGVVAVVRPIVIPIWVEPWYSRARIVGFRRVWVWEFVPAEFIKTISLVNQGGQVRSDIDSQVVLDRQLMNFWRFLR